MLREAPTIETERLRLRAHRLDDFAASAALWADPSVVRFIGGRPFTAEESWSRILRYFGHWPALGFGFWLVEEKSSGDFVGEVGCGEFKRDMAPSIIGVPEIGWVFTPSVHGRGYATEAAQATVAWADTHLAGRGLSCIIAPANQGSIRVAEKCGFREHARSAYKDAPTIIFLR